MMSKKRWPHRVCKWAREIDITLVASQIPTANNKCNMGVHSLSSALIKGSTGRESLTAI